jgi:transcriptional regulator with XRE-family HTH domain
MNWLKERRKELNLKQEELAARLQVEGISATHSAISHWETGRYKPPFEDEHFRQTLANILKMDVATMLRLAGYEIQPQLHTEEAEEAAYIMDNLPPNMRDLAIRLLREFARDQTP